MGTKEELIQFLEDRVLGPIERHPLADEGILRKVRGTRMRLKEQRSAEKVEQYFWSAMATDRGIVSYERVSHIGAPTFEDVRADFRRLCGR